MNTQSQSQKYTQMSETFVNAIFLTLSGGFQDAYTYCCRGEVFANAQTGNIVRMSLNLFEGNWGGALRYLVPIFAFISGIYCAELLRRRLKDMAVIHWRQIILLIEICLLFLVGFMPFSWDYIANAVVSFVCALQVHSFRKIGESVYASTMCIGNLRSATELLCSYVHTKDKITLKKSMEYFGILLFFAIGAGIGGILTDIFGKYAIWLSCLLLAVSFVLMFFKNEEKQDIVSC